MTNVETAATQTEQSELPGMLATLCSYENFFGPFHPQTLMLTAALAAAYRQSGEANQARRLLEKVIKDSARYLGPEHAARLAAIEALRDLFIGQGDVGRAVAAQRELLECRMRRFGDDHAETRAARTRLCEMLIGKGGRLDAVPDCPRPRRTAVSGTSLTDFSPLRVGVRLSSFIP
jgi:hypothetical protein